MVSIFPNPCLWRRSLRSNLGGIDLEKLYRATLNRKSEVRSGKWEVGSGKWELGGQKSNHAALSFNGQKSGVRTLSSLKFEV